MAQMNQKQLKGEGLEERKIKISKFLEEYTGTDSERDNELFKDYCTLLCEDIGREKARLGGDWAVATVIKHRYMRDFIR